VIDEDATGTRVKICGITRLADAEQAAELGAWAIGLIHHRQSPRYCAPDAAAEIGAAMKRRTEVVGVFVNAGLDEIAHSVEDENLTIVQLHGDEGKDFCQAVARRTGARVMKALQVRSPGDVRAAEVFRTDFHLFDAFMLDRRGGTGQTFDWALLGGRRSTIPMVLSGGLTPSNVAEAIASSRPYAVDVATGTEAEPGIKDPSLVEQFFEAVGPMEPSRPGPDPGTPAGKAEEVAG